MFDFFDVRDEYDIVSFPVIKRHVRDPMITAASGM
jgi:hypothetical protein